VSCGVSSREQVTQSLDDGAYVVRTLARVYRERGIEAASTELYKFVEPDRAKWAVLAAVIALAEAQEKIERMEFDRRHLGDGGPTMH
jgi:hypothetical protein